MTTGDQGEGPRYYPSGPPPGQQPQSGQYPQPRQYPQYPQNPYGPGATGNPYPYTPYAAGPAGLPESPQPLRRPGAVIGALVLLLLSALPFLVLGVLGLFVPIGQEQFPPELGLDDLLTQYGVSFDQFLQAVRLLVALLAVLALVYIAFAFAAFAGRNWGRIVTTVLTALFSVFLLFNLGGGTTESLVVLVPLVLSIGGVVLLWLRPSSDWYAGPR